MPDRVGFPAGVPSWIDTTQPDPAAAASFYGPLFGWEFEERMPPASGGSYLMARLDGRDVAAISSQPPGSPPAATWNTYVQVDDVDATLEEVRSAGGAVVGGPLDVYDAGRMAVCADPAGAVFSLWQPGAMTGAELVNAPGTWNFSELNTGDVDGAKRFYGTVFGWEAGEVDIGALAGTMVRLPGYADFLEQFDPGIKQRHADFGAPPGFSDCVAWILPLQEGTPHWSVTFAVADTDAVTATAQRHGGTVVIEPLDVPPVRTAVLRDPAGAQFTVSAFTSN
jgi:predicted enzyme related to lactoylglutathione lyase